MVPQKGLEPPLPCENMDLNHARLPIPPLRHSDWILKRPKRAQPLQIHLRKGGWLCQRQNANRRLALRKTAPRCALRRFGGVLDGGQLDIEAGAPA